MNLFASGLLIVYMSHKSFSDIIGDTLHIGFSLSFRDPPSASNPMSKIRLKSPPYKDGVFRNVYVVKSMIQVIKNF